MRGMLSTYIRISKGRKWDRVQEYVATQMYRTRLSPDVLDPKSIRVIKDEAQFFGFCYLSDNGKLIITEAGNRFVSANDPSEIFRNQLLKLQITNPAESVFIRGILVFPFRVLLHLLLNLGYLTWDELGLFVFQTRPSRISEKLRKTSRTSER